MGLYVHWGSHSQGACPPQRFFYVPLRRLRHLRGHASHERYTVSNVERREINLHKVLPKRNQTPDRRLRRRTPLAARLLLYCSLSVSILCISLEWITWWRSDITEFLCSIIDQFLSQSHKARSKFANTFRIGATVGLVAAHPRGIYTTSWLSSGSLAKNDGEIGVIMYGAFFI